MLTSDRGHMGESGSSIYNRIGSGYNSTRQADTFITNKLYELLSPRTGGLYLDIGCGTGNYTIALAIKGLNFYGVEPSGQMLEIARSKNQNVHWLSGRAEQIPADDQLFDGAIATLTLHHWADIEKGFKEIYRVLKYDSRAVIFTATPQQMKGYWLNHYFPLMLAAAIAQMPSVNALTKAVMEAGCSIIGTEKYFVHDDLKDYFLYAGKNRPEIYLGGEVRKNISSFSIPSNSVEIRNGLSALKDDIGNDIFKKIKGKFDNYNGDYSFIILEKKKSLG